jgi:hypothetical protein
LQAVEPTVPNVAELIKEHVTLTVDCVDRVYLNAYVPRLQSSGGVVGFLLQRGQTIPSPAIFGQITEAFKTGLRAWADQREIPWLEFKKGERKDDVVRPYRERFEGEAGVVLIGVAQERAKAWRATKEIRGGYVHFSYRWTSVCVNHYYVYFLDPEWGPGFLKICGYAPYTMKLCLNGHEWAKRQLTKQGLAFQSLDNGFRTCADPAALQAICDRLGPADFLACLDRWLDQLPLPLTAEDRRAGFAYRLSILQLELSTTQVFDRPLRGREFFEQVIRDQLDLGRPSRVQLLFDRKIIKTTPGRFSTRVITHGVIPSLHVEYKRCHVKQYFKEGRALRTETTINDAHDFGVSRGLHQFSHLRTLGQRTNTRLLELEQVAHDCALVEADVQDLTRPSRTPSGQPAPGLKLGEPRVTALLQALCLFALTPDGITNRRLRPLVAQLLSGPDEQYTARQMGYDLRRLARKGLIQRRAGQLRYILTPWGRRVALFLAKLHGRVLRPGLQAITPHLPSTAPPALRLALQEVDIALRVLLRDAGLAA